MSRRPRKAPAGRPAGGEKKAPPPRVDDRPAFKLPRRTTAGARCPQCRRPLFGPVYFCPYCAALIVSASVPPNPDTAPAEVMTVRAPVPTERSSTPPIEPVVSDAAAETAEVGERAGEAVTAAPSADTPPPKPALPRWGVWGATAAALIVLVSAMAALNQRPEAPMARPTRSESSGTKPGSPSDGASPSRQTSEKNARQNATGTSRGESSDPKDLPPRGPGKEPPRVPSPSASSTEPTLQPPPAAQGPPAVAVAAPPTPTPLPPPLKTIDLVAAPDRWSDAVELPPGVRFSIAIDGRTRIRSGDVVYFGETGTTQSMGEAVGGRLQFKSAESRPVNVSISYETVN